MGTQKFRNKLEREREDAETRRGNSGRREERKGRKVGFGNGVLHCECYFLDRSPMPLVAEYCTYQESLNAADENNS